MLRPRPIHAALVALVALAAFLAAPAEVRAGKPKRYHFLLTDVKPGAGVTVDPATVDAIKAQAEKVIASNPQLVATLAGAPALDATFPAWRKYLAKKKIAGAFRVNIEITAYEEAVEDQDPGTKIALRQTVRLSLRMFGETIPMRTIAFTGDGSSTVKADVGRRLRDSDRAFNVHNAIELAVDDAMAVSLHKLETAPPPAKK